jgi:hypothetical protein
MRWVRERSGAAPTDDFGGDWAVGDMRRDNTRGGRLVSTSGGFF